MSSTTAAKNSQKDAEPVGTTKVIHEGSCQMQFAEQQDGDNGQTVFYNPVQVQNRDLSVLMIVLHAERRAAAEVANKKKRRRNQGSQPSQQAVATVAKPEAEDRTDAAAKNGRSDEGLEILDALAASGLRSMRYWKECAPHVKHITVNDLDPAAYERACNNLRHNGLAEHLIDSDNNSNTSSRPPGICIQTADATDVLYNSRRPANHRRGTAANNDNNRQQWDVIDLDPYGSAAPFLDAAVQAVAHGGLLNVTCTDMAALGGSVRKEKRNFLCLCV